MIRRLSLFGALREADVRGYVELDIPDGTRVAELRELLVTYLGEHAPHVREGLVRHSALATADTVLHDQQCLPEHGELAILPPVSGG